MLLTSLLTAGVLALQTSASLIPLRGSPEAKVSPTKQELRYRSLELDCPGCPFAGPNGNGSLWTYDEEPISIHLDLDIAKNGRHDSLYINTRPVYPYRPKNPILPLLEARQIRTSDLAITAPLRLGYALEFLPAKKGRRISLTPIRLTILDLGDVPVKVDTVEIILVQSPRTTYMYQVTCIPYSQSPGALQCGSSICRLRAIIAHRVREMVEAARARAGKAKTWLKNCCRGRKSAQNVAQQDRQNFRHHQQQHHDAYNRHNRLRHSIMQQIYVLALPVLQGVLGGILVCSLVSLVLRAFIRLRNHYSSRQSGHNDSRDCETAVEADEKECLVVECEMPPQYQDVDVVVVEEK